MSNNIPRFSPSMAWLLDMVALMQGSVVTVPTEYRAQVLSVKQLMKNDESGLIASLLDFGISSAADVNLSVETSNPALSELLNNWLSDINGTLIGQIPIGIDALSKEYYRERWKGSSLLLLRTVWEDVGGYKLPVKMWFVDGEDIDVSSNEKVVTLGDEKYSIIIDKNNPKANIKLPTSKYEKIFIQKPYTSWGIKYPTPFIIQRGLYKNALFLKNLVAKGEIVVAKALEYLMVVKKGTEALAKENRSEFIYSDEDLNAVKEKFGLLVNNRVNTPGVPSYITNFDTDIEHLIPEYERILKPTLYAPIEKRILAGIGMIDIVAGAETSRREGTLNPKPFIGELNSGVNDFKALIKDILLSIIIENQKTHPKYFSDKNSLEVRSTPVKAFMTDDYKTMMRSIYDRGGLSKRTFVEVVGETSYGQERDRRIQEVERGDDVIMFAPVIQNQEQTRSPEEDPGKPVTTVKNENTLPDRTGPEAKNFDNSSLEQGGEIEFEQAPYDKNKDLPSNITDPLPSVAQTIWRKSFNAIFETTGDEAKARQGAWRNVKLKYKKDSKSGKWTSKNKKELAEAFENTDIDELVAVKKLELLGKQEQLLDKFIKENLNETT